MNLGHWGFPSEHGSLDQLPSQREKKAGNSVRGGPELKEGASGSWGKRRVSPWVATRLMSTLARGKALEEGFWFSAAPT